MSKLEMYDASYIADIGIVILGVILVMKRIAEMDGHHAVRVVILASFLSFFVICFFLGYGLRLGNTNDFVCDSGW